MPREQVQRSLGSGVIVDPSGLVVTNNHVIEGASEVKVSLADKREFEAEIVLKDERSDLAVLRIKGAHERFPVLEFGNSDELQVGDVVLAIGDPFGVGQTVTHGIVSAVARTQVGITDYQFFIQTDAAINPGNSGGALVDAATAGSSASIPRSSRARAARRASASPSRRTWCGSWSPRPRAAAARSSGPGSAPSCRRSRRKSPKASASSGRAARWSPASPPAARRRAPASRPATSSSASTARWSTIPTPSTIASPPSRWAAPRRSASCARASEVAVPVALQSAARNAARRGRNPRAFAVPRRHGGQPFAGAGRRAAARPADARASSSPRSPTARRRSRSASRRATSCVSVNNQKIAQSDRSRPHRQCRQPAVAHHHRARRPADFGRVQWMSPLACRFPA